MTAVCELYKGREPSSRHLQSESVKVPQEGTKPTGSAQQRLQRPGWFRLGKDSGTKTQGTVSVCKCPSQTHSPDISESNCPGCTTRAPQPQTSGRLHFRDLSFWRQVWIPDLAPTSWSPVFRTIKESCLKRLFPRWRRGSKDICHSGRARVSGRPADFWVSAFPFETEKGSWAEACSGFVYVFCWWWCFEESLALTM